MKRGRAAVRARRRAVALALALAVVTAAVAPVAPGRVGGVAAQGGKGTIVHSEDGVLFRAEPDFGAEVLTVLPQGTSVALRTDVADTVHDPDGVTQWWPVQSRGADGWVAGFYLRIDGFDNSSTSPDPQVSVPSSFGGTGSDAPVEEPFLATWDLANAAAIVAEPDGVNMRQEPGTSSPAVKALSYQTLVELRVDELDTVYSEGTRWWPVRSDDLVGWVSGRYLAPAEPIAEAPVDVAQSVDVPSKVADFFAPGSYVEAITEDGSGINIRADGAPDAERIGIVPESDVVQVMDGPYHDPIGNPWYLITDGEVTGFVAGWYLQWADQPDGQLSTKEIPSKVSIPGVATGQLGFPLSSWVFTQAFGCSPYWFSAWNPTLGCHYHNGIDLAADMYTPIAASDGGVVEYSGWCDCGLGYYVKINHGNGFKTVYGHMAEMPYVATGQAVSKGDVIGPLGSTGLSTGPHIHFIVEVDGMAQDPLAYLG
jgi:hypothetical protein